jgi:hypothetical protein
MVQSFEVTANKLTERMCTEEALPRYNNNNPLEHIYKCKQQKMRPEWNSIL